MTVLGRFIKAEVALRNSEEKLALAIDAHQVGIFEWDRASGTLSWSPGTEQRLGLPPGTIVDFEAWKKYVHCDDFQPIMDTIAEAETNGAPRFGFRYRLNTPNGIRVIEGLARCVYDSAGLLVRTVGVNIDVTDRAEREAELKAREVELMAREAQLQSVLKTVPDAMIIIDQRGVICAFSASAEIVFGYSASEVIGMNVSIVMPKMIADRHDSYLKEYIARGKGRIIGIQQTLTAKRRDGVHFPVEVTIGEAITGESRLFTGFIRDVSEKFSAEERLADMRSELLRVSRVSAMGELAAGLAHELNQPLAANANFLGAAQMLLQNGGDLARVQEFIQMASAQNLRAGETIRRMRQFLSSGDVDFSTEPLDEIIRDAVALVMLGSGQYDIGLDYQLDPAALLVLADPVQIQQVLVNLLRNAVEELQKMPASQRHIIIGSRLIDEGMVEISISDSGPGLDAAVIDTLFTPFVSTKGDGDMGVGLSISHRIIEAHGGKLRGENKPEGGAIFRLTLPHIERAVTA